MLSIHQAIDFPVLNVSLLTCIFLNQTGVALEPGHDDNEH